MLETKKCGGPPGRVRLCLGQQASTDRLQLRLPVRSPFVTKPPKTMAADPSPGSPSLGDADTIGCAWRTGLSDCGSASSDYEASAPEHDAAAQDSNDKQSLMIQVLEARLEEVQGKLARMEGLLHRTFCRVELTENFVSWLIDWVEAEAQDPVKLAGTLSRLRSGSQPRQPVNQPNGDNNSDVRMTPRAQSFSP